MIKEVGGKAESRPSRASRLLFQDGRRLAVTDAKGDTAMVTIPDVMQSNGVIHVIDTVLLPG